MGGRISLTESQDFVALDGQPSTLDEMSGVREGKKAYIMDENIPG
jgi:hypothetical protein